MSTDDIMINGVQRNIAHNKISRYMYSLLKDLYPSTKITIDVLKALEAKRRAIYGDFSTRKLIRIDNSYYWDLYTPAFKSVPFDNYIQSEAFRIRPHEGKFNRFTNVFLSITNKCAFKCRHCYEWDNLNKAPSMHLYDYIKLLRELKQLGVAQIQLSGGEPMLALDMALELIRHFHQKIEFWMLTSGQNFTKENAKLLHEAGLTGVVISLDHHVPALHNKFRNATNAFDIANSAIDRAVDQGFATALSLCATKEFLSNHNLYDYLKFAKTKGVGFVQLLEPYAVGQFSGMDVELSSENISLLDHCYLSMNKEKRFSDYPIVVYHGYYQRRIGCFSSGVRNIYIDANGNVHSCPFNRNAVGNVLQDSLSTIIPRFDSLSCTKYSKSEL